MTLLSRVFAILVRWILTILDTIDVYEETLNFLVCHESREIGTDWLGQIQFLLL